MSVLAWLLALALSAFGIRCRVDVRAVSDGNGLEVFAVVCMWVDGEPQTLTCRQVVL